LRDSYAVDIRQQLTAAIGPEPFLVWHLRTVDRWSIREIQAATGHSETTVRRHIRRGKQAAAGLSESE
jgi:DNA-directed RNA polymerase specialized sigma24 family protein